MINTTFCMAPWTHLYIQPNGDVYPCCLSTMTYSEENISHSAYVPQDILEKFAFDSFNTNSPDIEKSHRLGSLVNNTIEEIWNGEKIREVRLNMIKGKPIKSCSVCYKNEELTGYSYRTWFNNEELKDHKKYLKETKSDGTFKKLNLALWDFRLTNVCNFKCRMCGPTCSSSWEEELKKKYNIDKNKKITYIDAESVYDQLNPLYDTVEKINFAGGEPLISDHHYVILENLIEKKRTDVTLEYFTNFSTLNYKGKHIFDYWEKFNNIIVIISLDGIKEKGELIRNGFNWEKFLENVYTFKKRFPNKKLMFHCVVQILNCFHFIEVHKFLYENKIIENLDDFKITLLHNPEFLSISVLDLNTKKILAKKIFNEIKEFLLSNKAPESTIGRYKSIIKLLKVNKTNLLLSFKSYIDTLDEMRGENTLKTFPELSILFD